MEPGGDAASRQHQEWADFLTGYAQGGWSHQSPSAPAMPISKRSHGHTDSYQHFQRRSGDEEELYPTVEITDSVAAHICRYVANNDYLPPPRSPLEQLREKCILDYDLYGDVQRANIQDALNLISAFFPHALTTFTMFRNRQQSFFALAGPDTVTSKYQVVAGGVIQAENSLCGHSVLTDEIVFVPNLADDWRFRSNPYTRAGISGYIGRSVSLKPDPSIESGIRVGVGVLNILFVDQPHPVLTPSEELVVRNTARMLETQLRATWEGHARTQEAKQRRVVTEMIEKAFVQEQLQKEWIAASPTGLTSRNDEPEGFAPLSQAAVDKLQSLLPEVDCFAVLDISNIMAKLGRSQYILNSACTITTVASSGPVQLSSASIMSFINNNTFRVTFDMSSQKSGLESELPSCRSHLAIPFFTGDQPLFMLVATSSRDVFPPHAIPVTRSVGCIVLAKAVQSRVMEADAAKTAFLSSISHELRTPMHSIMTGLHLAKDYAADGQWDQAKSVLDVVESSGVSLKNILNDVLDFSRTGSQQRPRAEPVDLVQIARSAADLCLRQFDDLGHGFEMVLEYEKRSWQVEVDEAKYQRILINGLTNALKFCKNGPVTISLSTSGSEISTTITDRGIGFHDSDLPHLMAPFTKLDMHSPGTGLGLHITKNLLESMEGRLKLHSQVGKGTTFTAVFKGMVDVPESFAELEVVREVLRPRGIAGEVFLSGHSRKITPNSTRSSSTSLNRQSSTESGASIETAMTDLSISSPSSPPPNLPLRVLVVDDNSVCRRLLVMSLKKLSAKILTAQAANGQDAIDNFRTFRPDLVLTDVSMPVMDGVSAARRMREIAETEAEMKDLRGCRIYAITGLGSSDPRMKAAGMGEGALDGWLVKGQDDMKVIRQIVGDLVQERNKI